MSHIPSSAPPSTPPPETLADVSVQPVVDTITGFMPDAMPVSSDTVVSEMPADFLPHVDVMAVFDEAGDEALWARRSTASKHGEVLSATSAARGCLNTDLSQDQVEPLFKKFGLQAQCRGKLWLFYGTGERVASTFADLNTELTALSSRQGVAFPRTYLDTYSSGDTSPIDSDFLSIASHMLARCMEGRVFTSASFYTLLRHPRVAIYLHKVVKGCGRVEGKETFLLSEFKSVINELRAGGAEKQYGRESEMQLMIDWVTKFMGSEVPLFSAFSVHGDAMMGKTRAAEEVIKAIRAIQQKVQDAPGQIEELRRLIEMYTDAGQAGRAKVQENKLQQFMKEIDALPKHVPYVIFVPAKDTRMGDSLSFFRTYAKQVLSAARDLFVGDTMPTACQELEKMESMDATTLAKEGPQMLTLALRRLRRSNNRFLIITDDMQWADSESCDLLKQTFSIENQGDSKNLGHIALLNLARTGDQVMNEELLRIYQKSSNSGQIILKPLPFLDEHGLPTPLLISFVYGLLKINPSSTSIDTIVFEHLAKAVGGAQGNPGLLTEMITSMVQEGVLIVRASSVTYDDRFFQWTMMGEADVMAAARVDRLLAKPLQREALQYIVFLRETGECTFQLIRNLFVAHLKRQDLFDAFVQLCKQGTFSLQKMDSSDDDMASIVGFSRDVDERRMKSIFGASQVAQGETSVGAYREVAKYFFFTYEKLSRALLDSKNNPNRDAFLAVLDRCSPYAIYTMATKANMREMVQAFALEAFKDAYARGQFDVALSLYEYMKTEPHLANVSLEFGKNIDLQLDLIQCMQVKRSAYAADIEALGEKIRFFYTGKIESLGENMMLAPADFTRVERLHDLMSDFYFLRGSDPKVRRVSVSKLHEWGQGLAGYLSHEKQQVFPQQERQFMELKARFNNLRGEYLMRRYAQACEDHLGPYAQSRERLLRDFPDFLTDIRFQRVDLEGNRIFANAFNEGWNRALAPGQEGYHQDVVYADEDAAEFTALFPDNSINDNLLQSQKYFRQFFDVARVHPELVPDRTQLYRSRKTLARIEGLLGNLEESMQLFFDARSDCVKYGDTERYAETLANMSSPICKLVQYYQATRDSIAEEKILRVSRMIQRNEPGAILSNPQNNVASAAYFILQWAAHYSNLAATTFMKLSTSSGSPGHKFYYDVAMINLLGALSMAAETSTFFRHAVDDPSPNSSTLQINFFIGDAILRMTQVGPNQTKSFLDEHRELDAQGNPSEFWSLYIAPFLARLMRHMTRLDKYPQLIETISPADASRGASSEATLIQALSALAQEAATMMGENSVTSYVRAFKPDEKPPTLKMDIPQYAAVLERKIADIAIADQRVKALFSKKKDDASAVPVAG